MQVISKASARPNVGVAWPIGRDQDARSPSRGLTTVSAARATASPGFHVSNPRFNRSRDYRALQGPSRENYFHDRVATLSEYTGTLVQTPSTPSRETNISQDPMETGFQKVRAYSSDSLWRLYWTTVTCPLLGRRQAGGRNQAGSTALLALPIPTSPESRIP